MKRGLVRSSRYSPGNMDQESLEALFVGRQSVMSDVVEKMAASVTKKRERHYVLLVGPRGSGKTHFVALAYHRIRDRIEAAGLSQKLEVAYLNEEEWGVASYLDFLVRIVRALASPTNDLEAGIARVHERFSSAPAEAETLAESLLVEHLQRKTLLLICENLVDLFEGLGDEGQKKWRAFIQQTGFWSVLATTPALFAAVTMQDYPFYGFFTLRALAGLDFETARQLLIRKAEHDGHRKLVEFLNTPIGRARMHAIHHLAGGNHRAYVVLYDFLDKESLDDLIDPFMHMVDDLTPYYQDKMRQLAPAQRKITEFLCQKVAPVTVKEIATQCLMSQQTAAKQVGELAASGFVNKVPDGRQVFCELAEPLMRICIEVKDNRTEHFRLFVEFLRHWFSGREIEARITGLARDNHGRALDKVHLQEALRCFRLDQDEPFVDALMMEAAKCYATRDYPGLAAIRATVESRGDRHNVHSYVYYLRKEGKLAEAKQAATEALELMKGDDDLWYHLAQIARQEGNTKDALANIDRAIAMKPDDGSYRCFRASALAILERHEEVIDEARAALILDPEHWHSYEQILRALLELGRTEEADTEVEALIAREPNSAGAISCAGAYFGYRENYQRSIDLFSKAITIDPSTRDARLSRALAYFESSRYPEAREDFEAVISVEPDSIEAHCRLSDTLLYLKDYRAAIKVADRLLRLDPEHTHAYVVLGHAQIQLGNAKKGMEHFRALLTSEDVASLVSAAESAREAKERDLAEQLITRAEGLAPEEPKVLKERAFLYAESGDFESAWSTCRRADSDECLAGISRLQAEQGQLLPALQRLIAVMGPSELPRKHDQFVHAASQAIAASVQQGPAQLPTALKWLRDLAVQTEAPGLLGEVLVNFLKLSVRTLKGSREHWDQAVAELTQSLGNLSECKIPLAMLTSAVGFFFTGEQRYLLQLPLEQRQLLDSALRSPNPAPSTQVH